MTTQETKRNKNIKHQKCDMM